MDPQEDRDIMFIGIDFGTTFSGVAWAYSKEPESITTVTSWGSSQAFCSDKDKAPTRLSFSDENETTLWGYNASTGENSIKWFKLLLLEEKDVPVHVLHAAQFKQARAAAEQIQNTPTDLVSCYLEELWEHTLDQIRRSHGRVLLEMSELHVVVTLPAIWPAYAAKYMKEALGNSGIHHARSAGETKVRFVSEPEAAALATMNDMGKRATLRRGDTMIVCDAGGGTVDLISYEIQKTRPFVVKEIVKGDGGLCGGVFLDEAFLCLVKSKIAPESWKLVTEEEKEKFLHVEWENGIKPEFTGKGKQEWLLQIPEAWHALTGKNDLKRSRGLKITTTELRQVFDVVADQIVDLVRRQGDKVFIKTTKKVDFIILVGGFGRCRYLFDRIESLAEECGGAVLQSQGSKPWSAIARGAVVNSLTKFNLAANLGVSVGSRVARLSYGVKYCTHFIEGEHHPDDRQWAPRERIFKAQDPIRWFLNQGSDVDDHEPVRVKFYVLLESAKELGKVPLVIYRTEELPAPTRAKDDAAIEDCKLDWAGVEVNFEQLPKYTNPQGKEYRRLNYAVVMSCDMGTAEFQIESMGIGHGRHSIEIELDG